MTKKTEKKESKEVEVNKDNSFFDGEYASVKKKNMVVTTLYFVFTFFVIGYLLFGHKVIVDGKNPKFLAQILKHQVETEVMPNVEPQIEKFMVEVLPTIIEGFLDEAQEKLPGFREDVTSGLLNAADKELIKLQGKSFAAFEAILDNNETEIKAALVHFKDTKEQEQLKQIFKTIVREQYKQNVQKDVEEIVGEFVDLSNSYSYLLTTPKQKLTIVELEKRRALILAMAYMHEMRDKKIVKNIMQLKE